MRGFDVKVTRACEILRWFYGEEKAALVLTNGHSGPGWYTWCVEYPDEGSEFLGTCPEVVLTAKAIVDAEFCELIEETK